MTKNTSTYSTDVLVLLLSFLATAKTLPTSNSINLINHSFIAMSSHARPPPSVTMLNRFPPHSPASSSSESLNNWWPQQDYHDPSLGRGVHPNSSFFDIRRGNRIYAHTGRHRWKYGTLLRFVHNWQRSQNTEPSATALVQFENDTATYRILTIYLFLVTPGVDSDAEGDATTRFLHNDVFPDACPGDTNNPN
jgi:hypothetical protein